MEKARVARRGTKLSKHVVVVDVEVELLKEEHSKRSETGAFNELNMNFALPRQGMPTWGKKARVF